LGVTIWVSTPLLPIGGPSRAPDDDRAAPGAGAAEQ
jgi:hypothetical protein